ncbi:MAG: hypothetical protein ACFB20_12180 [Opitutales bacterium]
MSNTAVDATPGSFRAALRQGLEAARANRIAALFLWTLAGVILVAYVQWAAFAEAMDDVAALKERLGYLFSMPSTALFAGIIPLLVRRLAGQGRADRDLRHLPFFLGYWGYKGFEIDSFYRLQTWLFGNETDLGTIAIKLFVDQVIYNGLIAGPTVVLLYLWKNKGYSLRRTRAALVPNWYRVRVFPLLLATWAVWVPTVCVIYSLPPGLQLPVQNVILCFFVLLLTFMTREPAAEVGKPTG